MSIFKRKDAPMVSKRRFKAKSISRVLILSAVTTGIIAISAIYLYFTYVSGMSGLREEYGEAFVDKKIYMVVQIETANILDTSQSGVVDTDLGFVRTPNKNYSSVILVYRDFEGELIPIDNINKSNAESAEYLEYITSGYKPEGNYTILGSTVDKLKYKTYLEELDQIKSIPYELVSWISAFAALITGALAALYIKTKKEEIYDESLKLEIDPSENKPKYDKIERQGIGADGKLIEDELFDRSVDEMISNEGYIYKGVAKDVEDK